MTFYDLIQQQSCEISIYMVTTTEIELNIKTRKLKFFKTSPFKLLDYATQELTVHKITLLYSKNTLVFNTFNRAEQWKTFTIPISHLKKGIYKDEPSENEKIKEIKYYTLGASNYVKVLKDINNENKKTLKEYVNYLNSIGLLNYAITEKNKYETLLKQQLRKTLTNTWKQQSLKINS